MNPARSAADVGRPIWSSTTLSELPAAATRNMVLMKFLPWAETTHEVRMFNARGLAVATASSPSSLVAP